MLSIGEYCKSEITCLSSHLDAKLLIRGTQVEEERIKSNSFEPAIVSTCFIEDEFTLGEGEVLNFLTCVWVNKTCRRR